MWSPWRSQYIQSFGAKRRARARSRSLFSAALKARNDDRNLIVWRGKHCFVILNRYPYNSGHLMIVPNRQVRDIRDLTDEELLEIMRTARTAMDALEAEMHPQGYNFGANVGRVSGAGIDDHIHFHIVPRWNGDTNFMPVLADTKVISEDMANSLKKLRKHFKNGTKTR
jgi:ATP adenylyltransferase